MSESVPQSHKKHHAFITYQLNGIGHSVNRKSFLSELMENFIGVGSLFTPFQKQSIPAGDSQGWHLEGKRGAQCDQSLNDVKTQTRVKSREWSLTCGRQSGRDSKMTSRTPMGTVIWVNSRLLATLVLLSTRPTLSLEDAASWRRPMARLFNLAVDRLRRWIRGWEKRPTCGLGVKWITTLKEFPYWTGNR